MTFQTFPSNSGQYPNQPKERNKSRVQLILRIKPQSYNSTDPTKPNCPFGLSLLKQHDFKASTSYSGTYHTKPNERNKSRVQLIFLTFPKLQ